MEKQPPNQDEPDAAEQKLWRERLKSAREKAGKDPEDLAQYLGNSVSAYFDLENCKGIYTMGYL